MSQGKEEIHHSGEQSEDTSTAEVDHLVDRLSAIDGVDENVAEMLARNWQKLLGFLAALLLVVWLFGQYQQRQTAKSFEAADYFVSGQAGFSIFANSVDSNPKVDEDVEQKENDGDSWGFNAKLEAIQKSYPESIYSKLSELYLARANLFKDNSSDSRDRLKAFVQEGSSLKNLHIDAQALIYQLASLNLAKSLIGSDETREQGHAMLLALATDAGVVAPEALVTLARLASGEDERNSVREIAAKVKSKRPELAELIDRELITLGIE